MHKKADKLYLILSAIFIASLVTCNLIFLKFFRIDIWIPFLGTYPFIQSVGLLPYPITFLVTDIVSEIYGRKKANDLVTAGLFASAFILGVVSLAGYLKSTPDSPVNDETFSLVFGLASYGFLASMIAYLFAQYIDVRLFHFWKQFTKGKHLWLRNNASTIVSQVIDTLLVLSLLFYFEVLKEVPSFLQEEFGIETLREYFTFLFWNGFLFKVFFAAFDTPLIYLITAYLRRKFNLKFGEEVSIHT